MIRSHPILIAVAASLLAIASAATAFADPPASQPRRPATTTVTGKLWVDDFAAFVSSSGGKRWVVGRSNVGCLSESEASDSAIRDARLQLLARVRSQRSVPTGSESEAWLKARLKAELATGRLVRDRSVSRIHKPYGELWSEAVLVDASGDRLSAVIRDHDTWQRGRRESTRNSAASIVGLSVVILLIYAVLNAITKGYFRGRLRAAAAVALGCGVLVVGWTANVTG